MTNTTNDALARAIESLGAVEVAPGRYAYQIRYFPAATVDRWHVGNAEQVIGDNGARLKAPLMPSWWTPEQRYAWRCPACGVSGRAWIPENGGIGHEQYRVTADLNTGEEIPA